MATLTRTDGRTNREFTRRLAGPVFPLGRFFLAIIFLVSGVMKLVSWESSLDYMASVGLPRNELLLTIATAIELVAGLGLLFRFTSRAAAWVLALYLVPVSIFFHTNFRDPNQVFHLLKNIAIIGGLLEVAVVHRVLSIRRVYEPTLEQQPPAEPPVSRTA